MKKSNQRQKAKRANDRSLVMGGSEAAGRAGRGLAHASRSVYAIAKKDVETHWSSSLRVLIDKTVQESLNNVDTR